jgi:hypothetical protein
MLKEIYQLRSSPVRPFHDDEHLKNLVWQIVNEIGIKTFFETGTFRGDTLRWMAKTFPELLCISVEKNLIFYLYAAMKIGGTNVTVLNADSREILKHELLDEMHPVLYWLDAHWSKDWPLLDELRLILEREKNCVILIDDFKVPNHPTLGYDSYLGRALDYSYIKETVKDVPLFVPDYDGDEGLRGYAVIFKGFKPIETSLLSRLV